MKELNKDNAVYNGIDVFKLIAAVLVVLLHTVETTNYLAVAIKEIFTYFAVPFFFITSGFFFYGGLEKSIDKKKYFCKYSKNILKIFGVWALLIYLPFVVTSYITIYEGESYAYIIALLVRRIFVIGPGPYWYLVALFWSSVFLYLCYRKKWDRILIFAMSVGGISGILYSSFREYLSQYDIFERIFDATYLIFSWEFNFIMYGIPFMGIGYFIRKKKVQLKSSVALSIFLITTCMRVIEYNINFFIPSAFWDENQLFFVFAFQAISFFLLAKSLSFNLVKEKSLTIRQLSSFIYFFHVILLNNILNPLMEEVIFLPTYAPCMILPKVLIILSVCVLIFFIIKKINNKYLNILING